MWVGRRVGGKRSAFACPTCISKSINKFGWILSSSLGDGITDRQLTDRETDRGDMSIPKSSVGSQNLVTLIVTKTTFCQRGNTKQMAHILPNSRSSRPVRTPVKSTNHASKYRIFEIYHYYGAHFTRDTMFCHEKDAQNVVTGWFFTNIWSK